MAENDEPRSCATSAPEAEDQQQQQQNSPVVSDDNKDDDGSGEEEEASACRLPDDAVLHVLRFLPVRDVLRCRAVCRQWRDLALHADLWRNIALDDTANYNEEWDRMVVNGAHLAASLRLAPCLGTLRLHHLGATRCGLLLAAGTRCAASRLDMEVDDLEAYLAALIVRRQAKLGRLRSVRIATSKYFGDPQASSVTELLQVVFCIKGLESLELVLNSAVPHLSLLPWAAAADFDTDDDVDEQGDALLPRPPPPRTAATLRTLRIYANTVASLPRALALVRQHAATLEEVALPFPVPGLAGLLACGAPRLRSLHCALPLADDDDWAALLDKASLLSEVRARVLLVAPTLAADMSRLAESRRFLRAAARRVHRLAVEFPVDRHQRAEHAADVLDLAKAVADTRVRDLVLDFDVDGEGHQYHYAFGQRLARQLRAVTELLSGGELPELERLEIRSASTPALLRAVDPVRQPRLREFSVYAPSTCAHAWLARAEVEAVRRRNPDLTLVVHGCCCGRESCRACVAQCDEVVGDVREFRLPPFAGETKSKSSSSEDFFADFMNGSLSSVRAEEAAGVAEDFFADFARLSLAAEDDDDDEEEEVEGFLGDFAGVLFRLEESEDFFSDFRRLLRRR